jgi:hypothetical protein
MNTQAESDTRLHGRMLLLARTVWIVVVLLALLLLALSAAVKLKEPLNYGCTKVRSCNPIELSAEDVAFIQEPGLASQRFGQLWIMMRLAWNLSFLIAALLIFWQRSDDWLALLMSMTLALLGGVAFSSANAVLLSTRPELTTWGKALEACAYAGVILLLLMFPNGRFVPSWTRWALLPFPLAVTLLTFGPLGVLIFAITLAVTIYSQVYRYRRVSSPLQRQQTKWVIFGLLCVIAVMSIWFFMALVFPAEQPTPARTYFLLVAFPLAQLIGLLFPFSIVVAILRYRLWDIDIIIRRTLIYGALTATLAVLYFGSVVVSQQLFRAFTGQSSELAIIVSTLAIAALFVPLRQRVQSVIDRRFYRRKYDAARTLAQFGASLRDDVNLDSLSAHLLDAVDETMQPETVGLWLAKQ